MTNPPIPSPLGNALLVEVVVVTVAILVVLLPFHLVNAIPPLPSACQSGSESRPSLTCCWYSPCAPAPSCSSCSSPPPRSPPTARSSASWGSKVGMEQQMGKFTKYKSHISKQIGTHLSACPSRNLPWTLPYVAYRDLCSTSRSTLNCNGDADWCQMVSPDIKTYQTTGRRNNKVEGAEF